METGNFPSCTQASPTQKTGTQTSNSWQFKGVLFVTHYLEILLYFPWGKNNSSFWLLENKVDFFRCQSINDQFNNSSSSKTKKIVVNFHLLFSNFVSRNHKFSVIFLLELFELYLEPKAQLIRTVSIKCQLSTPFALSGQQNKCFTRYVLL